MTELIQHQMDTIEKSELVANETLPAAMSDAQTGRARALALYARGDLTIAQIAGLHHVSKSTIVVWAKQDGLAARTRGRRPLAVPTLRVQQVLRSMETQTYKQLASRFGVSKARVGQMVDRWRHWIEENSLRIGRSRIEPETMKEPPMRREPKLRVLSFRLTEAQVDRLASFVADRSADRRRSIHQLARSVVVGALGKMTPQ